MFSRRRLLTKAVGMFGSEVKLGLATGYTQRAINRARKVGSVTPLMAYRIHVATNGLIDYRKLCPLLDAEAELERVRKRLKRMNGGAA